MLCDYCRFPIYIDQPTFQGSTGSAKMGQKSGQMYHSSDMERPETIHLSCLPAWVYKNEELRGVMRNEIIMEVRRDEIDDLKQIAMSEAAEELQHLCAECGRHKLRPDDPPDEYSCSGCGSAAMPVCPDCGEVSDIVVDSIDNAA